MRVEQKQILSPHEELNLRPSDSILRCSTPEPQRLNSEQGLSPSTYDMSPTYCWDQQCR